MVYLFKINNMYVVRENTVESDDYTSLLSLIKDAQSRCLCHYPVVFDSPPENLIIASYKDIDEMIDDLLTNRVEELL